MPLTSDYRKGKIILYKNEPHLISDMEFYSPGKGAAFYRLKLKNLATGKVIPVTIKSDEKSEELEVNYKNMQYLYADGDILYFMDPDTYEQFELKKDIVGKLFEFMKEGEEYTVTIHKDQLIYLKPPAQVILTVTETTDAVKGNTAQGATKDAILETGAKIQVPLFIKEGEKVKVDPETGSYFGRAK